MSPEMGGSGGRAPLVFGVVSGLLLLELELLLLLLLLPLRVRRLRRWAETPVVVVRSCAGSMVSMADVGRTSVR
jgi:hypothetical protein